MAIQLRRGTFTNFNAAKMAAGEVAVVLSGDTTAVSDGKTVYVAFGASDVKRLFFANEFVQNTATKSGYVSAPGSNNADKVWKTGSDGTPAWREETVPDTNLVSINTSASAGTTDGDLYGLISELGWASDVIS